MKKLKQARVKWHRFGETRTGLMGESFEDAGERLAIITCPWCGRNQSMEYFEYMQRLRVDKSKCMSCGEYYTLRPLSSLRKQKTNNKQDNSSSTPKEIKRPTGKPDGLGRRDWGDA